MSPAGSSARRLAVDALVRIDQDGAYANLVLPGLLEKSRLSAEDRRFATELVYGTTRMRRACDAAIEPYVLRPLDPPTRAALRLGAYQLLFMRTPPHAAVSATVDAVGRKTSGLVNAVLRRLAAHPPHWPDPATALSYPDWIVERLSLDLGPADAAGALQVMNEPPPVTERGDGYVQDLASQWVAAALEADDAMRVLDVCAAPGGKATALASGRSKGLPEVVAGDLRLSRARLMRRNVERLGSRVAVIGADAAQLPFRDGCFDRVLVDAPCSGLGALRRRPDARWRIEADALVRLAELQRRLVDEAVRVLAPGGLLVYSVCTLSALETRGVDDHLARAHPFLRPAEGLDSPWAASGRGWLLLPQAAGTDGMYVLRLRRPHGHDELVG